MTPGSQDPGHLGRRRSPVDHGDEVEEVVGVGERATAAELEGNPALGIEPHPSGGGANPVGAAIDAPHPGARKLPRQEESRVAVAAVHHQHPLGRRLDPKDGGGERGQRGGGHGDRIV